MQSQKRIHNEVRKIPNATYDGVSVVRVPINVDGVDYTVVFTVPERYPLDEPIAIVENKFRVSMMKQWEPQGNGMGIYAKKIVQSIHWFNLHGEEIDPNARVVVEPLPK